VPCLARCKPQAHAVCSSSPLTVPTSSPSARIAYVPIPQTKIVIQSLLSGSCALPQEQMTLVLASGCTCRPLLQSSRAQHRQAASSASFNTHTCTAHLEAHQHGLMGTCRGATAAVLLSLSLHGSPLSAAELPAISADAPVVSADVCQCDSIPCMHQDTPSGPLILRAAGPGAAGAGRAPAGARH
jgi:hypothetical protein